MQLKDEAQYILIGTDDALLFEYKKRPFFKALFFAFKNGFQDIFKKDIGYRSAALSFYAITALVPLIVVLATFLTLIPIEASQIVDLLYRIFPKMPLTLDQTLDLLKKMLLRQRYGTQEIVSLFNDAIARIPFNINPNINENLEQGIQQSMGFISTILSKQRGLYAVGGFLLAYYFSSTLFLALQRTIRLMFDMPISRKEHILLKIISIPIFIIGLFVVNFGAIIISGVLKKLLALKIVTAIIPPFVLSTVINIANSITFFTFVLFIFLLYHFQAVRKQRRNFKNSIFVTIIIGFIFTQLKNVFGYFVALAARLNPIYGTFSGIFGFLFWVFLTFVVLLAGARVLYHLEKPQIYTSI